MHVWDPDGDRHSEQENHYTLVGTVAMRSMYLIVCIVSPSCSRNWPGSSNGWWRTESRPQSLVRRRRRLGHVVCAELVNEATFLRISHTLVCQFTCLLVANSCSYQPLAINGYWNISKSLIGMCTSPTVDWASIHFSSVQWVIISNTLPWGTHFLASPLD